jgi:hypothetical protein
MNRKFALLSILAFTAVYFCSQDAFAYQVKRVVKGSYTFASGAEVANIDLTGYDATIATDPLDTTKTVVFATTRSSSTANTTFDTIVQLDDNSNLLVKRFASATNTYVEFFVVEFSSGVRVTNGSTTIGENTSTKNITLPNTFDATKTFVTTSWTAYRANTGQNERNLYMSRLTGTDNLEISRTETGGAYNNDLSYQVVEFLNDPDVTVQSGTLDIDNSVDAGEATDNGTAATVTVTSVDTAKSFLIMNFKPFAATAGSEEQAYPDGVITNSTTLTFTRTSNTSGTNISWFLVEFKNEALAQNTRTSVTSTSNTAQSVTLGTTLTSLDRAFALMSRSAPSGVTTTGEDEIQVTAQLSATNTLQLTRSTATAGGSQTSWFVLELPPLDVISPNGTEVWKVGETKRITWRHAREVTNDPDGGGAATAHRGNILLSHDGGSSYPLSIVSGITLTADAGSTTANEGSYDWTIPSTISSVNLIQSDLKVRVIDTDVSARNYDHSNANFEIKGTLSLTAPNGGEAWLIGAANNITWGKTGDLDYSTVTLKLSLDSGSSFLTTLASSLVPSDLAYSWTPGNTHDGTSNRVRVELASDTANVYDESNANFAVRGSIDITAPDGGESWPAQTTQNITWTRTGDFPDVKIEYSTNSGGSYPTTIVGSTPADPAPTDNSGTYAWSNIAVAAISTFARVKVTSLEDSNVNGASAADFSVVPSLKVTSPDNGTEVWRVGDLNNITWTLNGSIANVKIEYSKDDFASNVNLIIASAPADPAPVDGSGFYAWTVPDDLTATAKVRVSDAIDANKFDISDNNFKIRGNITVTAPNGGEVWAVGSSQLITWVKDGTLGNVDILYSINGGTSYPNTLATNVSGTSWAWNPIPDNINSSVRVKVRSTTYNTDTEDVSDANFAIKGSFTITSPNGTEQLSAGGSHNITWTSTGTLSNATLEYDENSGLDGYPSLITNSVAVSAGTYAWTLPVDVGTNYRVRIKLNGDTTVMDTSNSDFSIRGSVTLTAPNGGQTWIVGNQENITWTYVGTIANVKLEYSTDGGSNYFAGGLISASAPVNQAYTWTVADAIDTDLRIRVSDANDSTVNDQSNANFTIKGSLTVTDPNGGESWVVGSSENITWNRTGTIASVKIDYSTNGFADELQNFEIIASTPGGLGTYSWTIPNAIGTALKVRVTNVADNTVKDESDFNFGIKGSVTVTAPNGGEAWSVGDPMNITWTKTGTLTGNLKLEYSTDGGTSWPVPNLITNTQPASGSSYSWTIPDAPTVQGRVRITQVDDTSVTDTSDGNFSIKGQFILDDPNGGETWIVGENRDINWTRLGSIANARLDYSVNGGSTYPNQITASTAASNESYTWSVPDAIGTQLRVKITDANDGTVSDTSNADFTVKGSLTITAPNGGETWVVGASQNITWTKTGTIPNVKLEYSRNAFSNELQTTEIVASTPGAGLSYAWTIPDAIGSNLKVRITNLSDATVTDVSNAAFAIKGSLTMGSPNGGETWIVGESRNLIWTMTGSIANVKLEYSTNAFLNETETTVISASTPAETDPPNGAGSGQYAWTVADAIGANVRLRVTDVSNATVVDVSNASFTIKGSLTMTSPNGGEIWAVLENQSITWTRTGTFNNVRLSYSTDSGSNYSNEIIASTPADPAPVDNAGSYVWTIPDNITVQARVRVENASDTTVFDDSNGNFKIRGGLAVSTPNGGEKWTVGDPQNISWNKSGTITSTVKLDYSTNAFANETQTTAIATGLNVVTASPYAWTVADAVSQTVRIRVTSEADSDTTDISNANFKIMPKFTITSPNGGEVWSVASSQTIGWTTLGSSPNVELKYSTDGGNNYDTTVSASTSNTGSFSWTVPDAIGTAVRVRVAQSTDTADAFDTSNANFKIRGVIQVNAPNGGEQWNIGSPQNIQWTRTGSIANVKIEYSSNAFANELETTVILASTPADPAPADNIGIYAWTLPDNPGVTNRVRVSDASDATAFDTSNANFSIKGQLTLNAPNGGETWIVATTQNIQWTRAGSIPNVKIEYSTDGGTTWPVGNVIIGSTPADPAPADNIGTYSWTIPDAIGNELRVRVSDAADASVEDTSAADFEIKGSVAVTSPNGGETWLVGNSQNITWASAGSFLNVKLEYSTNAFSNETQTTQISGSTPNDGTFSWSIPDAIGTNLKVRVTDTSDASVTDVSNAAFTIKGSVTVTSPNGTEVWKVGEARSITWNRTGTFANVKIEYSTNGGSSYPNTIVASTDATTGTYPWTVPDAIGAQVRVKVTNTGDSSVADESNANFEIKGTIALTAPNGGESWTVASLRNVTWTKTGTFATVKLEYSTNAFSDELQTTVIATGLDAATGTPYSWTVPDAIDNTVKVRVTNEADAAVVDVSDTNFKITGALTLTAPNGGENWSVASSRTVSWNTVGSIANVKLEYSTNSGGAYPNVITASTAAGAGAYSWTIPDSIGSTRRVKVTDVTDATVSDESNADFSIMGGFTVTSPNGGEVWTVASGQSITWNTDGTVANVKLEYSTNGFVDESQTTVIAASTANTGTNSWTVPNAISTTVKVRVTDASNANAFDISNGNFKIRGAILVNAPNGGEAWFIGNSQNIQWTRTGSIANVKLEYSSNAFVDELETSVIIASTPADPAPADNIGIYAWTIPDNPGTTNRVRVTDASDATVLDTSNSNFSIKGQLVMQIPNGGEVWTVAGVQNIQWSKFGAIVNVSLQYSTDSGGTWPGGNVITASTAADPAPVDNIGVYSWTIPDAIGTQLRVRVVDTADSSTYDDSNADFKIRGAITLTAPNGGENWNVGSSQNITWTSAGSFSNVKLEYSTNGFSDELQTFSITSSTPNDGTFSWTIPDAIGTSLKVRASDVSDATVVDLSNGNFTIKGSLTVTSPNGTEVWKVGEARNVTWNRTGSIANVKIEYSTNGGSAYPNTIIASTGAGSGTYAWTVPDAIGTQLRVRVSDVTDATVEDSSNANFEIKGTVTLTGPNGGEVWTVGSSQNITWTKTGTYATVKLEYSTNAFADELQTTVIATGVDSVTGTPYAWTVPDTIGTALRVRVSNEADAAVADTSNLNFKIAGAFTLNAPNGGENWGVGTGKTVTWTRTGSIANAKLELSLNGGSSYSEVIVASTGAAAEAYIWTIPDMIGSNRKVKISDAADASVFDESNANFAIMGAFNVTAPDGGEVWTVNSPQSITWTTTGTVSNVKLEYSTNAFSDELQTVQITASTPNTGTYSWTVADAISNLARVRVSDVNNVNAFNISTASFKIRGALLMTAPNGGEPWEIGTAEDIEWTRTGSIANVKLEFSTNGFSDELQTAVIIASTPADPAPADNNGVYSWTIPDAPSTAVKVRVTDASDATVLDTSNANFTIKGRLLLSVPNGGEVWTVAGVQNITWTKFGSISTVALYYSTDSGGTWPGGNQIVASTAADPAPLDNNGFYSWTIPDAIGTQVRVRVQDTADSSTFDDSNADFKIRGAITVTSPNGSEIWIVGASQNITWTSAGSFSNVKLEYSTNGFSDELQVFSITTATPNDGSFSWTIPDAIGSSVRVRASDAADNTVTDASNANFTIKGALVLTSPNGTELWKVGENRNITWNRTGSIANVKLEYSTNGGSSFPNSIIASTSAASGTYAWTVPDAIGTQLRVRVSDVTDITVEDSSNANFEIKGTVTLVAPNGGEVWTVGSSRNITWTKTGTYATVKLEYSTNAFANELQTTVIATGVDSVTGTPYAWTVPDTIGTQLRVRVTNESDTTVLDSSDLNFKIAGSLTLNAPNGSENWGVGTSKTVTWTRVGSIANAKLELSLDGGSTFPEVIVASTGAAAQAYIWTIPDMIGSNRRVKISDASDATVFDNSNANFAIMGAFAVTQPNGGEVWTVGSAQSIEWNTTGTVANVKLEYSTNAFSDELQTTQISASAPNTGTFSWTVADAISNLVRVRVSDVNNASAFDISNASFKIRGALLVTAPNGGEPWEIGTSQNITWTRTGSIANVKLEYSTNGFVDELQTAVIIASTPADPAPADNIGAYSWNIPDTPSTTNKVRVTDASDATVLDTSNSNFIIKGRLVMDVPDGGEIWTVAGVQNIQWTKFGAISNVQLQYSTDSGGTWPGGNIIIASTAADPAPADNSGFYSWTIPDAIGTQVRVRVQDAADSSTFDDSDADFKIRGAITITSPNGGEVWIVGANQNITWTHAGTFSNVKLEYSTNGFTNETQTFSITAATPNNDTFSWSIPDAIGSSVKVRASDAADNTVTDSSNGNFTIKGSLSLTSPNGGEVWKVAENRNVTWNKAGSIANVKLEYSNNGGSTYPNSIIASTDANTGSYTWAVADAIGTQLRVRVSDVTDTTVNDTSDANFEIKGTVLLVAPNGSEQWPVNTVQNITWTKTGTYSSVKLEYSTNAFADELQTTVIATGVDSVTGTPYGWTVPDVIGSTVRVRVTNESDALVTDKSDNNFKIVGALTVTAPNGGENWNVGTSQTVSWNRVGSIANVKLEYSTNGGSTYPNLIVASTGAGAGAYAWTVPDSIDTDIRVKVTDASDATVFDTSNANFAIVATFDVTQPDGGEVWTVGSTQNVTWTTNGSVANVKLEYSTDGGNNYDQVIANSTPNNLTYSWIIPDSISTLVKVRVSDVNNPNGFNTSNAVFKIRGALTLNAPNGGEQWGIATVQNIQWTRTGSISNVKLEYSSNAFADELQTDIIVASTPADPAPSDNVGIYGWTIPDAPGIANRVRVIDVSDSTVLDLSNSNFSIKGSLTITAPNGSENWIVDSPYNITWVKGGAIANVKLQYSTDGGTTWPDPSKVITASTSAGFQSYTWTIPDDITGQGRIRILDTIDNSVNDISNANFAIKGSLRITSPNGTEIWTVGESQNITWTKTGSIANVMLEYSTDGGSTYPGTITASTAAAAGTYAWVIPDSISTQVRVKITQTNDAVVTDASDADFKIRGSLTVTSPNGGEVWRVANSQPITWTKTGTIPNVKIEYSVNGGATYPNVIATGVDGASGSYSWTIPNSITTNARVKITNEGDTTVFDASNADFKIAGSITVLAPNGGEKWQIAANQNITWSITGSISSVKIEYSTDGGATYPNEIVGSIDATAGTPYAWVIPDTPTTQARVRITNAADTTVFDASNANFKIQGSVVLVAPNGGEAWTVGESRNITWTKTGSFANVKIDYSVDGGANFTNSVVASTSADSLAYSWTIPDNISVTSRVKVTDLGDIEVTDESSADFTIRGAFTLTVPNGGEVWRVGQAQNITWTKSGSINEAKLEYSTNGFLNELQNFLIIATTPAANLSYAWNIPDNLSNSVKVRISDVAGVSLADTSNGNFAVKGTITLNLPNGGESFPVDAVTNITWTRTGSFANVKLEYSTNAFSDESQSYLITGSTPADPAPADNTGLYAWTVPDAISTTVKVRVTDANDAATTDVSNNIFTIRGMLTMTSPNGSEKWIVGTTQLITWDRFGSISNCRLQYTTNGTIYTDIIASTPNTGTYAWTIPNSITTTARVRIYDTNDTTVTDTSDANFRIQAGFNMLTPNGGENWLVGSSQNITWTTNGTVNFVKLDYSIDGGTTFDQLISSSTPNGGSYAWTVADTVAGNVVLRVSDTNDSEAFDTSNASLRIRAAFGLITPNGSEQWRVGRTQNITWINVGTVANVKLQYSRDGFQADNQTIVNSLANTGTYGWVIPDSISNSVRVKVSDVNDIGAFDISNADFRITGDFAVTAPNGGEKWDVDSVQTIAWTRAGTVPNATLEYSTNAGGSWSAIVGLTANNGTYDWTIPDTITANGRVRVSDPNDATANDISDANFKIKAGFTLLTPNGGQVFTVGESHDITWSNTGTVANARLSYSTDGGATFPNQITASTPNDYLYSWTIPDSISSTVRVRAASANDVDAYDDSNANLKIRGKFQITAPNGNENWRIAQSFNITWVTTGTIPNLAIYYSTDAGATFPNVITASTANTNSYAWTIPDVPTTNARIRLENVTDTTVYDDSDANFKIQGFFTLNAPNGGEAWIVGTVHNIEWTWGGTIPNVKLTYSTDGGSTFANVINASAPNGAGGAGNYTYSWTVPDNISPTVRVRVEDPNDATVGDSSNANFKIVGSLTLTSPNGGERWVTYEVHPITWTTQGTIPNVRLAYSHDDFGTQTTIAASVANTNTYNWTIPDPGIANVPKTTKVRVEDASDASVGDNSDAAFNIDYYYITWDLRDLLTNGPLSGLTVKQTKNTDETFIQWQESGITTNPARVQPTPYGVWGTVWSKTGFGDVVVIVTANSDQSFSLFMETTVIHLWLADSRVSYDPTAKTLSVTAWLSRDGSLLAGGALSANYKIYNGPTLLGNFPLTKMMDGATDTGYFSAVLDAGPAPGLNLQSGIVYTTLTEMPIASGGVFKTPSSFEVTTPTTLQSVKDTVDTMLDKPLSQMETAIRTDMTNQLTAQTTTIQTQLDTQTNIIQTKLDETKNTVTDAIEDFTEKSSQAVYDIQDTANRTSIRIISPDSTKPGKTETIRISTVDELLTTPTLEFFCPDGTEIGGVVNTEKTDSPGVYSAEVTFGQEFRCAILNAVTILGRAIIPSADPSSPAVEATAVGAIGLQNADLDTIQGLAAAAASAAKDDSAQETKAAIDRVVSMLAASDSNVFAAISDLQKKMNSLPNLLQKDNAGQAQMRATMEELVAKLSVFMGKEGIDLRSILKDEIGEGMKGVRNKIDRTMAATQVVKDIIERKVGKSDEPIVQTFYEIG